MLFHSLCSQLLQTAVFWQIFELTGSALHLGLTGLARAGPHILLSLVGGVIADRLNRVRLIQIGQVLNSLSILIIAGLTLTEGIEVWHLYVITLLNSGLSAVTQPARTALIPNLVPRNVLVNAVALNATIGRVSQIIGPALAGIGIATVGLGLAYILSGLLYVVAIVAILGLVSSGNVTSIKEGPWKSFLHGMSFVISKPVIISLLVLDLGAVVLGSYRALLPMFADILGVGPSGYGFLNAAPGVGSLAGAGALMLLGDMKYKGLYTVFGVLAYCLVLFVFAISPWFLLSLIMATLLGTTDSIQAIPRNAAILAMSPNEIRGRVEAFRFMLAGGGPSVGFMLSGAVAAVIGAPLALSLGAVTCTVLVVGIALKDHRLRDPHLGNLDTAQPEIL